jgi:ribosomal protein S27E
MDENVEPEYVKCESCGESLMHPARVAVVHAGEKNTVAIVDKDGVRLEKWDDPGRGVKIMMELDCELCNNATRISYVFHKGSTSITKEAFQQPTGTDTIWRD